MEKSVMLFVGGFPKSTTGEELVTYLSVVINSEISIKNLNLMRHKKTGEGRGFGFLELTKHQSDMLLELSTRDLRFQGESLAVQRAKMNKIELKSLQRRTASADCKSSHVNQLLLYERLNSMQIKTEEVIPVYEKDSQRTMKYRLRFYSEEDRDLFISLRLLTMRGGYYEIKSIRNNFREPISQDNSPEAGKVKIKELISPSLVVRGDGCYKRPPFEKKCNLCKVKCKALNIACSNRLLPIYRFNWQNEVEYSSSKENGKKKAA